MTEQSHIDLMRAVKRERETEQRVRAMDASDIVEEIHRLEDALEKADAEYNRLCEINAELLAALKECIADRSQDSSPMLSWAAAIKAAEAAIARAEGSRAE